MLGHYRRLSVGSSRSLRFVYRAPVAFDVLHVPVWLWCLFVPSIIICSSLADSRMRRLTLCQTRIDTLGQVGSQVVPKKDDIRPHQKTVVEYVIFFLAPPGSYPFSLTAVVAVRSEEG